MTERNDHAAKALDLIDPKRVTRLDTDAYLNRRISEAQVHATLALVEQQRIANLIALAQPREIPGGGTAAYMLYDPTGVLREAVREGLGL